MTFFIPIPFIIMINDHGDVDCRDDDDDEKRNDDDYMTMMLLSIVEVVIIIIYLNFFHDR